MSRSQPRTLCELRVAACAAAGVALLVMGGCATDVAEPGGGAGQATAGASGAGAAGTGGSAGFGGASGNASSGASGDSASGSGGSDPATGGSGGSGTPTGGSGGVAGEGGAGSDPGTGGAGGFTADGGREAGAAGNGGAGGGTPGDGGAPDTPVPLDPALMSLCSGTNPIKCTIPVPANGDYTVTVELGSATAASTSRVQAELYRISVPPVTLAAGSYEKHTFSLNVRYEKHDGYQQKEKELNLLIDGAAPALHGLGFVTAPTIPTIFVAGDSTVCDWDPVYATTNPNAAGPLERGWAQELSQYLKPGIAVANYADSGETAASFYGKFWAAADSNAKAALRAGDYAFIQFGHNDQGTAPAVFQANMMKYVTDARAKNAIPVLFTPPARKASASTGDPFLGLATATRDLATRENVTLVDLTAMTQAYYKTLQDKSVLFAKPTEGTHFGESGATQLSKLVVDNLKTSTLGLRDFLK